MKVVSPCKNPTGSLSIEVDLREGAYTIVFHFSDCNTARGKFNRFPTPRGVSNVYLNPANSNWYLDGLPDFENLSTTVAALKSLVRDAGASQIVCIGSGMGAWGAAYIAPMLEAQIAILFSPELRLNCVGSISSQSIALKGSTVPTIHATSGCRYVVVAGMMSPCNIYSAAAFFGDADLSTCYFIPWMGAATDQELSRIGVLSQVIENVLSGRNSLLILDAMKFQNQASIAEFFVGREYNINTIAAYIDRFEKEMDAETFVTGIVQDLINKKLYSCAFALLWSRFEKNSLSSNLKMMLLTAAGKAKKPAQVLRVADDILKERGYRKDALFAKALALERLNRIPEARAEMSRLCVEYLQDPMFKVASKRLAEVIDPMAFHMHKPTYVPGFMSNTP